MVLCIKEDERYFEYRILYYIEEGKSAVVKELLESFGNFCNLVDSSGSTLLHYAVKFSNIKVLEYLISSGSDVDAKDNDGCTPLMLAVRTGRRKIMVKLLEAKARIDVKNNLDEDALCMIARLWTHPDRDFLSKNFRGFRIVRRLLLQLKLECSNDCQAMANRLLESKCPLYYTVFLKNATVTATILKSRKIDSRELAAAIHVVAHHKLLYCDFPNEDTSQILEILKILLPRTNVYDNKLRGTIGLLLKEGNREVVRTLLQHIDLHTKTIVHNVQRTYLHELMFTANKGIVNELLADAELDFDATDSEGGSCLRYAVRACNLSTVEFLLRKGVQVNGVDREGLSVLFIAISRGSWRKLGIMNILLKYGADVQCISRRHETLFDYTEPRNIALIKPVIARLAMLESLGKPISQLMYDKIESRDIFKSHFKLCKSRLERMKRITVHKSVTLYKLLTESDKKVVLYVQNPEFPDRFNRLMRGRRRSNAYYDFLLRRRTFECIQVVQLKREASAALSEISQVDNHTVTDHVLGYLSADDWKSLRGVH